MDIDEATIFKIMQAIVRARSYAGYNKVEDIVRVDSRRPDEMNMLDFTTFRDGLKQLDKMDKILLQDYPDEHNKDSQKHSQIKILSEFEDYYQELGKEYPAYMDAEETEKFKCGGLFFTKKDGKYKYNKAKGVITPGTAPWTVLIYLLKYKGPIKEDTLKSVVISNWKTYDKKYGQKSGPKINIKKIVQQIRRKLKMGNVKKSINKDLIKSDHSGSYSIDCKK